MRHARIPILMALSLAAVAIALVLLSGGDEGRRFTMTVPAAANIVKGNELTAGSAPIGSVTEIEPVNGGRAARLEVRVDDESYWPLANDSRIEVRQGGTVSFANRYLLLSPGKRTSGEVADGGALPPANVKIPVELDTVIAQFDASTRKDIGRLVGDGSRAVGEAGPNLHRALGKAPPVVDAAAGVLGDLAKNQDQLAALVTSTSRVVDGVDRATPDIRVLLDGLSQTFTATASRETELKLGLTRLPNALTQTRTTMRTADVTLREATRFTDRLAPGVSELRRTARPLTTVLASLRDITPGAKRTLAAVGRSGPTTAALARVADITPLLNGVTGKATEQLKCLRPYAPELAVFGSTWGDFMSPADNRDHLARAQLQNFLPAAFNSQPATAEQVVARNAGVEYAFPRPPGMLAAQPWFLPECGAGPDALDPSKDQESAEYKAGTQVLPSDLKTRFGATGGKG